VPLLSGERRTSDRFDPANPVPASWGSHPTPDLRAHPRQHSRTGARTYPRRRVGTKSTKGDNHENACNSNDSISDSRETKSCQRSADPHQALGCGLQNTANGADFDRATPRDERSPATGYRANALGDRNTRSNPTPHTGVQCLTPTAACDVPLLLTINLKLMVPFSPSWPRTAHVVAFWSIWVEQCR
jgi:hypothetical protein